MYVIRTKHGCFIAKSDIWWHAVRIYYFWTDQDVSCNMHVNGVIVDM